MTESPARDLRCMITGVSLLGAECACSIIASAPSKEGVLTEPRFHPVTLPVFGVYSGNGLLENVPPGPNAELIATAFERLIDGGTIQVDWPGLGIGRPSLDHVETVLGLLALAHVHRPSAITCDGNIVSLAFYSAHVAASLMDCDATRLAGPVALEDLPDLVFRDHPVSFAVYGGLRTGPIKLRCRFGLMMASQASLEEQLESRNIPWLPPDAATPAEALTGARREEWLEAALRRAEGDELLLAGLSDYLASGTEETEEDFFSDDDD